MGVAGNLRNGENWNSNPNVVSTEDYEYAVLVTDTWDALICQRPHNGTWTTYSLSSITNNPLALPVTSTDAHHQLVVGVDARGHIWIVGNMHTQPLRMVRSMFPHDITYWQAVSVDRSTDGLINGQSIGTYNFMDSLSDGTLLWVFNQYQGDNDPNPDYIGQQWPLYTIAPGASTWTRQGILQTADRTPANGDPDRPYIKHMYVDKNDVVWLFGCWRWIGDDPASQRDPFVICSRDRFATWETVDGTPVTMPLTAAEANSASNCRIDVINTNQSANLVVDDNGYPHVLMGHTGSTPKRYGWNGTAWVQYNDHWSSGYGTLSGLAWAKDALWYVGEINLNIVATDLTNGGTVTLGGAVPDGYALTTDPYLQKYDVISGLIPDGNTPVTEDLFNWEFRLTVTDDSSATGNADLTVPITIAVTPNQTPSASFTATPNPAPDAVTAITLDGSASSDPDGTIASYQWELVSGPGSGVFSDPTGVTTTFTPDSGS